MAGYCSKCGAELATDSKFCNSCGASQVAVNDNQSVESNVKKEEMKVVQGNSTGTQEINLTLSAILGFLLPGLPQLIFLKQTTKGAVLLVGTIVLGVITAGLIYLPVGIVAAIDAYKLSEKANAGKSIEEWEFFWSK